MKTLLKYDKLDLFSPTGTSPSKTMKYKKLPVEIEAEQFNKDSIKLLEGVCYSNHSKEDLEILPAHIHTLEGVMTVSDGDYVIKGVKGEFYPCKPDIFEMTYERVD